MPFGFNKEQWESLKKNQLEYNRRHSKIIEENERNLITKNSTEYNSSKKSQKENHGA